MVSAPARLAASAADRQAFTAAFQAYAVAMYQMYFSRYSGQSLSVVRSYERSPGDVIVVTNLVSPNGRGQAPLEVDFRVRTDGDRPVIVDFSVAGIWLALMQRDDFAAVLPCARPDVDHPVSHPNRVLIVLDHDQGVAQVS